MGNGDKKEDRAKIHEANVRTTDGMLDYLLTAHGYTGYVISRVERGKIKMVEYRHTHPIDSHGRMAQAVRHDPDRL